MTRGASGFAPTAPRQGVSIDDIVSSALFIAVSLFFWISVDPFVDLTDPTTMLPSEGSNTLNQIVVLALAGYCLAYAAMSDMRRFGVLFTRGLFLLLAWLVVSVATSVDPSLSARRYVLTLIVFAICAITLVLPRDVERFADLLAISVLIVLAVCYASVFIAPDYAVHQAAELREPEHAGHWRGSYHHKNAAGAAMVLITFIGLYVARVRSRALGWFIVVAAAFFLVRTMAKTSMTLALPSLALTWLIMAVRSTGLRCLIVLGVLGSVNLLTIGSVLFPPIRAFNESVMSDPSFTNRTDIWTYAVGKIAERPLFGHGFEAFWGSQDVFFGESSSWANRATNSHSSYLDAVLMTGLPGLCLIVWVFVIGPLRDLKATEASGNDPATTLLYMRCWSFAVFFACLESFFFTNGGPVWLMLLMALFGMRFQAGTHHVRRPEASALPVTDAWGTMPQR